MKTTPAGEQVLGKESALGLGLRELGLLPSFLALKVGRAPLPFLNLVVLFAHKCLYIPKTIGLLSANMSSRLVRFNTYLVLVTLAFGVGCKSPEERKRAKTYATFGLYLEVNSDASER